MTGQDLWRMMQRDAGAQRYSQLSSFSDHLRIHAPELLPGSRSVDLRGRSGSEDLAPHGTTIVALAFDGGVLIAGDRRATMGNIVASRDIEKVFITDEYSAVGIAGTAGVAVELVRLFAVELEHYEKIEGVALTLDGKANRLATMVRGNLGAALQGLAVVPLFVGFDVDAASDATAGRIISFDVTGGRYEEHAGYYSVGSGSLFARSALKKTYRKGLAQDEAEHAAIAALFDASDDDTATGGFDAIRQLYPTMAVITPSGAQSVAPERISQIAEEIINQRRSSAGEDQHS
ncbi:proteasome subunit beta [Lolliginicoccus suaedae]|uniref:proteasome subunit beta n=1 Tax=Lolliginicoccus suaedae TaxID=2605429 RepID=UPI0038B3731E